MGQKYMLQFLSYVRCLKTILYQHLKWNLTKMINIFVEIAYNWSHFIKQLPHIKIIQMCVDILTSLG